MIRECLLPFSLLGRPMAKSLKQVLDQINKLQQQADEIRNKEVSEVIGRIRVAIEHYGLTPQDLFGNAGRRATTATASRQERASSVKHPGVAKYASEDGRTWTGTGKKPAWFVEALAAGKTAQDLLIDTSSASVVAPPAGKRHKKAGSFAANGKTPKAGKSGRARETGSALRPGKSGKAPSAPKYQDGAGKTWTGVGKRPHWFVQALAAGRQAEDLLIPAT